MMPAWLSTPLILLGLFGLLDLVLSVAGSNWWALGPLLIAVWVGITEKRRIRKVTLIEDSATHMIWRQDYRKPVKGKKPSGTES